MSCTDIWIHGTAATVGTVGALASLLQYVPDAMAAGDVRTVALAWLSFAALAWLAVKGGFGLIESALSTGAPERESGR